MKSDIQSYYKLFNDFDDFRASQYDNILSSDIDIEVKAKLTKYYNEAKASIPNLGDKSAKVLAYSVLKLAFMTPEELKTAMAIGTMVNSAAPEEWRVKR